MAALPEPVTAVAYRASNGELAWRRHDLPTALAAVAASGQAVLGGWHGLIPDRHGGPDGVWHWSTTPRAATEGWQEYCNRVAADSAQVVAAMRVEEESAPAVRESLRFNLTYIPEVEA
jgi:hypothetical protein